MFHQGDRAIIEALRAKVGSGHDDLWWAWRLLSEIVALDEREAELIELATDCFVRIANADAGWAVGALTDGGPPSYRLAVLFAEANVGNVASRISAASTTETALLRAAIFVSVGVLPDRAPEESIWQSGWTQLQNVPHEHRDDSWRSLALSCTAHVAYEEYRALATLRLQNEIKDFWRASFLPEAFAVAARHGDWPQFEQWAAAYRSLPPSLRRGHSLCKLLNIEGQRALDDGRPKTSSRS